MKKKKNRKIKKPKLDCLENNYKIDKSLTWPIKRKGEKTKITSFKNEGERGDTITDFTDIKREIMNKLKYFLWLSWKYKFLEKYNLLKWCKIGNMNSLLHIY